MPRTNRARVSGDTSKPVEPIYTSDPNDPRLKAYQDSLNVYNDFVKIKNLLDKKYSSNDFIKNKEDYPRNPDGSICYACIKKEAERKKAKEQFRTGDLNQLVDPNINPSGYINYLKDNIVFDESVAKIQDYSNAKPVQPVVYRKPETGNTNIMGDAVLGSGNDFRHQPGGIFYSPEPSVPTHPTTPTMKKMPMRGMPSTNVSAEPIGTTPKSTKGMLLPLYLDSRGEWVDAPQTGQNYSPEQLRKMGYRFNDGVKNRATINKYDFGGLVDYSTTRDARANSLASMGARASRERNSSKNYKTGFGNYLADVGLGLADNTLGTVGLSNVINSDTYSTKLGNEFNKAAQINSKISEVVAPIVLSAVGGPLAGSAYSAGRSALEENVNPNTFKHGGQAMKTQINIEGSRKQVGTIQDMKKGELRVDLLGNVLQNYAPFNPHPTNGMDQSSTVTVNEGDAIIPKKKSVDFKNSNRRDRQMMIMSLISKQKAKERKAGIPMAKDGWTNILSPDQMQADMANGASSGAGFNWGALASKAPEILGLLSPAAKVGRGLFDRVENINASDYTVPTNLKPSLIDDKASQMMINDATNAGLASLRRINSSPASLVNLSVNSMKQKWGARQEVDRANASSIMNTDQFNQQSRIFNSQTGLKIRDMNDMNKSAKRNMLMEGINDFSKYGNQKRYDNAFFEALPMMGDNPQFQAWLKKNGYSK